MQQNINEIFAISKESPRYADGILEIHDKLINIIQKIEVLLYTRKGKLLCQPDFGVDLEKYIFETNISGEYIKNDITMQIWKYVMSQEDSQYNVWCDVNFYERDNAFSFMCVVDIYIEGQKVTSYVL